MLTNRLSQKFQMIIYVILLGLITTCTQAQPQDHRQTNEVETDSCDRISERNETINAGCRHLSSLTDLSSDQNYIDLTKRVRPVQATDLGQGTNVNLRGDIISADSQCLLFNNQPWMPVVGEFHYSRYPQEQWRDELLKIKAGGITIVSTYVFWIHHQEKPGEFNWSGCRDLRRFLLLCRELDLLAFVRIGPWCHGEVRNGGLPDWVQNSGSRLRTIDPAFLAMVGPFYEQIARQTDGLLWKDGGPVIAVQLDNERNDVPYLLELKKMARACGIDVPLYTMTGWNRVNIPSSGLLPLFGSYSVAFWYPHSNTNYRKSFFFSDIRDDGDMGAQFVNQRPGRSENILRYPYVCCEIGGGMPSSYSKRVYVDPQEIAAMALVRLGCGNNMQGYYMYHGGVNPQGVTSLNETSPNYMPVKDYDFQAPLGAGGQIREHYFLLRMQHMFIATFAQYLARMPLYLPEQIPTGLDDTASLRWSVRSDGQSGFIFFNNYQPGTVMPEKENISFILKQNSTNHPDPVIKTIPDEPITIPSGSYGLFPFALDCDGITLEYATAMPLCRLVSDNDTVYFFSAIPGIKVQMKFSPSPLVFTGQNAIATPEGGHLLHNIIPGTDPAASFSLAGGQNIHFVILPGELGRYLAKIKLNEIEHVIITQAAAVPDGSSLRLFANSTKPLDLLLYPAPKHVSFAGEIIPHQPQGIFTRFAIDQLVQDPVPTLELVAVQKAGLSADTLDATQEESWGQAAIWDLNFTAGSPTLNDIIQIDYQGNAARIYADNELLLDNFYNGRAMEFACSGIPDLVQKKLQLKILPLNHNMLSALPPEQHSQFDPTQSYPPVVSINRSVNIKLEIKSSSDQIIP